jgi:hypothetical protein
VQLSAPAGSRQQDVAATVIFEGAVRAVLSVSPPSPVAGQTVAVALQLRTRRGPITDPDQLHGLAFVAGLRGTGFAPLTTDLQDREGNGQHEGRLTVPATATGRLSFTGSVSGIGISGDQRTYDTLVATVPPPVQADRNTRDVFTVARAGGGLTITRPGGTPQSVQPGVHWDLGQDDLHVVINDRSTRASPTPTSFQPPGGPEAPKNPTWY